MRMLPGRDLNPSVLGIEAVRARAREKSLPIVLMYPNGNVPAWSGIPLMRDDWIVNLAWRCVYNLRFKAMALISSFSRTIARPRETIVLIGVGRPAIFAAADRCRRIPPGNALDVRSGQNSPGGFVDAILLGPCASAQFAARSLGSALL